jgi:TetR/AcrR family transcriptional repressor of nem operon
MRTKAGDKEKLKAKILAGALPYLKKSGLGNAPVDKIMAHADLTSGALYSHFKSKDDLFTQVVFHELDRLKEAYATEIAENGSKGLKNILEEYLSWDHVRGQGEGCVFAALSADMHRGSSGDKSVYEEKINELFEILASGFSSGSKSERQSKARFVFASLVGTMAFARSMKSKESALEILNATKSQLIKCVEI